MDFSFSQDQLLFQANVRSFLTNEVTPERIRELWQTDSGRSDELWAQLVELGLTALSVPEAFGGLGLNELDFVLLAQECGYAGLPEPLVDSMLVGVPLLTALDDTHLALKSEWLTRVAEGRARLAVGQPGNQLVADAQVADLLLLAHGDEVHAVPRSVVSLTRNESVDPSRQLFRVDWTPSAATCVAEAEQGRMLWAATFNRGALGTAAQLLGLAKRMVDLAVDYSFERKQFGKPVGSFQAVKHLMANVAVQIEFAKGPLYRAAYAVAHSLPGQDVQVSHAKLVCAEAALLAAKNAIQTHGAMGYTWEVDLQLFMKRAWALDKVWGDRGQHKARIRAALFDGDISLGAGQTF
ncbi:acyl-CoA dehydrogenase [Pseudomonas cavernicola]|uniref:Acyl-CoA dehydrogenase n=1 Tax=Pseudomonas cavernicola TaxID=2320866 RepID=A0A418XEC6_9PSED|nr:acyl-CoA dehydrogenase family protein [Pseudomonas cavernicola]RJG10859.1 acyl-CoA dehydrogenase [Pseudomonas cavernicola]